VIDLSSMKGVRVDPTTNAVRAEAGCTQADPNHAAHSFGLAVPVGVISTTGIAGLTLGAGTGYLTRKYGLALDKLSEEELSRAEVRTNGTNALHCVAEYVRRHLSAG
jgi:FAD/FMN-containing dehydrogenase